MLTMIGIVQHTLSRQSLSAVHRIQLAALARTQARSAVQELLQVVARDVNDPESAAFRKIRETMDDQFQILDLTADVDAPAELIDAAWGRRGATDPAGARCRIRDHEVVIRGTRASLDIGGTEEWVGVLTLKVTAEVSDAAARVVREVEQNHEIRTLLAGPPRPFDQLGLYLGDLAAVTDPARVNRERRRLLDGQKQLRMEVTSWDPMQLPAGDVQRLEAIAAGMLPDDEVAARTPELPEEAANVMGFYHVGTMPLEDLDLVRVLAKEREYVEEAEAKLRAARADPTRVVQGVYDAVDAYSNALNRIWSYQRTMTVLPHGSERYEQAVTPYLKRLTAAYFLDRVTLAPPPDDPLLTRWLAGTARIEGVLDLRDREEQLYLTGELRGRTVVIVGEKGAHLEDLNRRAGEVGHKLTVVSLGGDVSVRGEVHAAVLMLGVAEGVPPGRARIGMSSTLVGGLVVPHSPPGSVQLEGSIRYDSNLLAAYPPKDDLLKPYRGDYVVVVSPDPLFSEGRAHR